jgi:aryl-alcohol dehydrogenase-like predicted oxidoreductase
VTEIKKLAARKGCTLPQIALAWVAAQGMIPIPGTTKPARLEENWGSSNIDLTEDEKRDFRKVLESVKTEGNRYSKEQQALVGH